MVIVMEGTALEEHVQNLVEKLSELGFDAHISRGVERTVIGVIGTNTDLDERDLEVLPGVHEVHRISEPYKLVSRGFKSEDTIIDVNGVEIGGDKIAVMAGPCSVESRDQLRIISERIKSSGANILRGGAFKPRTSPYSFRA